MTGRLIRILACVVLGLIATQASAQSSAFGIGYRWVASLDLLSDAAQPAMPDRSYPDSAFMNLMHKPFVIIDPDRDLRQSDLATGYFRRPDPEFGLPHAFRRQQQMRLGFSIRF